MRFGMRRSVPLPGPFYVSFGGKRRRKRSSGPGLLEILIKRQSQREQRYAAYHQRNEADRKQFERERAAKRARARKLNKSTLKWIVGGLIVCTAIGNVMPQHDSKPAPKSAAIVAKHTASARKIHHTPPYKGNCDPYKCYAPCHSVYDNAACDRAGNLYDRKQKAREAKAIADPKLSLAQHHNRGDFYCGASDNTKAEDAWCAHVMA